MKSNVSLLIGKKPEEIIKHFKSKGNLFSWDWKEVWQDANTKAFTVAKAMKIDLLGDIRQEVENAIANGKSFSQFKESLEPVLKSKGWWGKVKAKDVPGYEPNSGVDPEKEVQLGSPYRLKTIYRTNMDVAYSAGQYKNMIANAENRPWWQYNAVLDSRTRPEHRKLHGKVFRYDAPFWKTHFPPNDWGCRCSIIPLDDDDLKELNITPETDSEPFAKTVPTGKGWDYNPGEAAFDFSRGGKVTPVRNQPVFSDYNRPKFEEIPDEAFQEAPDMLILKEKNHYKELRDYIGFKGKDSVVKVKTGDNDTAIINDSTVKHLLSRESERVRWIPHMIKTLKEPYEVYMTLYKSDSGKYELRKTYIGLFKSNKNQGMYVVVRMEKDSNVTITTIPASLKELDRKRVGTLLWAKK